ncbi:MAG: DUF4280 domain-containing protein [Clostridiales Family XIII bacterium]|jgi:hypothetical protein|nr:DUF4280 domain-containing protein [Clostridiales Family XIII bacterium]
MVCSKGSHGRKINLPVSHGVYPDDRPVLTASDNSDRNIPYFGVCGGRCDGEIITLQAENGGTVSGKKCRPSPGLWQNTQKDARAAMPLLTTDSFVVCRGGGRIAFESSGQAD